MTKENLSSNQDLYSVVIPVYNSEAVVNKTVQETIRFFQEYQLNFQIILVNDGSSDSSWEVIKRLANEDDRITSVNFLKNYGQHTTVFCGIRHAIGDYIITMDDDMQNPPGEIIHLIEKIHQGYDTVFAEFREKRHNIIRKIGSRIVGYLNYKIFGKPKDIVLTNFRIFSNEVGKRVADYQTFYPYIPGLILKFSSTVGNVETDHREREVGSSNYTPLTILRLVARLLFNYSSFPLKFLSTIGFIIAFLSFLAGIYYIGKNFIQGVDVPGWTTIVVLLSFLNGFVIIMLGVMGEYLARMMNQLSVSESYHIKEIVNERV